METIVNIYQYIYVNQIEIDMLSQSAGKVVKSLAAGYNCRVGDWRVDVVEPRGSRQQQAPLAWAKSNKG
jgi:hypothetical protein